MTPRQECFICGDDLIEAFDEAGKTLEAVRLQTCGHLMHRDCIKDWYDREVVRSHQPECPMCKTPIGNGYEDFQTCHFPGPGRVTSPQDILGSFNDATRRSLPLLSLLQRMKSKLSEADEGKYEALFENLDPGVDWISDRTEECMEVPEGMKQMVERVGQMWAEEGMRKAFEEMKDNCDKWKSICDGLKRTLEAHSEYERIRNDRIDLKIRLREATEKNKRQAAKTIRKVAAARNEVARVHTIELAKLEGAWREEFTKVNNRWMEKYASRQAQVEQLKVKLTEAERERDAAKSIVRKYEQNTRHLEEQLAGAQSRLFRRKQRDEKIWDGNNASQCGTLKRKDVFGDSSEAQSQGLELGDSEDEESFVLPPETFPNDHAPHLREPTKREYKFVPRQPKEATSYKKSPLETSSPLAGSSNQPNTVEPRFITGRTSTVQKRSAHDPTSSTTSAIENRTRRPVSDPLLTHDDQSAPSGQLSSGPRFRVPPIREPGGDSRESLKKRSSNIFLDNMKRSHGEKRRIPAV